MMEKFISRIFYNVMAFIRQGFVIGLSLYFTTTAKSHFLARSI